MEWDLKIKILEDNIIFAISVIGNLKWKNIKWKKRKEVEGEYFKITYKSSIIKINDLIIIILKIKEKDKKEILFFL